MAYLKQSLGKSDWWAIKVLLRMFEFMSTNWYGFSKPDNQFVGATVEDDKAASFGLGKSVSSEEMKKRVVWLFWSW